MKQTITLSSEQNIAANPAENVWVQANAGTGKTEVLVQRLLRILFRSKKSDNNGILCLTYTNAAAAEMRNRILNSLQDWAGASDTELSELLKGIVFNSKPSEKDLEYARQIFFTYIDNPEYLKVKTIHGFCEEILHRFPIEAGLPPSWSLVSDAPQRVLLRETLDRLINYGNDERTDAAFSHIVGTMSEYSLGKLLDLLSKQYKYFFQVRDIDSYRQYFIDTTQKFLELDTYRESKVSPTELKKIIEIASKEINEAKKPADYLTRIVKYTKQYIDNTINFEKYKEAYLKKKDNELFVHVKNKDYLHAEAERVYKKNQYLVNMKNFQNTLALFDLSAGFAKMYRELKLQKNLLDFEDLLLYTDKLFSNPETMGWILSQLDIGIGHILVDEAQDTNPVQWKILRTLASDFFTDGDTGKNQHSLFIVGDTKQSIFGFQGADPQAFSNSRSGIYEQIKENFRTIHEVPLKQSFRSLPVILKFVDKFFTDKIIIQKTGFINNTHKCFRNDETEKGLIEINKLFARTDEGAITNSEYIKIIADKIEDLIKNEKIAPDNIMVLVRKRAPFTPLLTKELKRRKIEVAGNDRIKLPKYPAIRDLLNLIRFCLNISDDYTLCCVLKSPLFRLKEEEIFTICSIKNSENEQKKSNSKNFIPTTVFDVLKRRYPKIESRLQQIITWSKTFAPYSFFNHILNTDNTREKIIAALGRQIVEPLEEFITICLSYERTQSGTLRHFLKWFIVGNSEIKRDLSFSTGVRIVTVHGSKGLEAKVIFLIDTTDTPKSEATFPLTEKLLKGLNIEVNPNYPLPWLWNYDSELLATPQRELAAEFAKQISLAEYYRLLYVAITRARDRLYIYGMTTNKNISEICWFAQLWRVFADNKNQELIRISNEK